MSKPIPRSRIPDPHHVQLRLEVNGKVVQDGNTGDMLFRIPDLLEEITDVMSLTRGDIVLSMPS
jgi:acylpyruvate hydrolase